MLLLVTVMGWQQGRLPLNGREWGEESESCRDMTAPDLMEIYRDINVRLDEIQVTLSNIVILFVSPTMSRTVTFAIFLK